MDDRSYPYGQPVLVDFGSVRDLVRRQTDLTSIGTVGYVAPEQTMGQADPRSDLYSLAATMLHVLTHRHPTELPHEGIRRQLAELTGLGPPLVDVLSCTVFWPRAPPTSDTSSSGSAGCRSC